MKKYYDAILYTFSFLGLQVLSTVIVTLAMRLLSDNQSGDVRVQTIIAASVLSGIMVCALFCSMKWCATTTDYVRQRPYRFLILTALLAVMLVIPMGTIEESLPEALRENRLEDVFSEMLGSLWGYVAIALVAPLAEEIVFRGAILRRLLKTEEGDRALTARQVWASIALSSLLFALIHGNPAQIPHAFVIGLLLGWLYHRTGSIIPGIVYHWVNNSIPFLLIILFPDIPADAEVQEYFEGNAFAHAAVFVVSATAAVALLVMLRNSPANHAAPSASRCGNQSPECIPSRDRQ